MEKYMTEARMLAAQCWCDKETSGTEMDATLAEAVARKFAPILADAARYRWLREHGELMIGPDRGGGAEWCYGDDLDTAVDAALQPNV